MEHQKSKVLVHVTENYNLFRFLPGNRTTNPHKQDKIIQEIKTGNDILDESPILVSENDGKLDILDGQNRYEIAKKLRRPVHYIIKKKQMSMFNIARINSNVEKWTNKDFVNCYKVTGNPDYKKVAEFQQSYGIAIGVSLVLLTNGSIRSDSGYIGTLYEQFQTGVFKIKTWKEAVQIAEICKSFSAFRSWNSRSFVMAICKILENNGCDFDILLRKFQRDTTRLKYQPNWKAYAANLEEIYNIDNSKRRQIF